MKINFAHLCDYALLSQDRKMSVMGIFATILAFQVPWVHPTLYLAFEIGLEPAEVNRAINIRFELTEWQGLRPTPPFAQPEWKTTGQVETLPAETVAA